MCFIVILNFWNMKTNSKHFFNERDAADVTMKSCTVNTVRNGITSPLRPARELIGAFCFARVRT